MKEDYVNLLISYSVKQDEKALMKGFKFLGAGHDEKGKEVHVFQKEALGKFQARMKKIEALSKKAHPDLG